MFEGMKFAMISPPDVRLGVARAWWQEIEAAGFDALGIPDTPILMREGFVALAACALDTSRIDLMMTVTNAQTRDPSVMAGLMRALEDLAPGRLSFGFGAGDSSTYGTGLTGTPRAAMAAYIQTVRALAAGEEATFGDRKLHAAWRDWEPWRPRILVSAHGLPETRARATELVRKGAIDAGRDPESVEIWDVVVVSPGETVEEGGCMEYLIERIGGMIGPVDLTQGVQKLEQRGVRNLLFVGIGQDKRKVIQTLAKDVVGRRGGSGRSHERSTPMPSS